MMNWRRPLLLQLLNLKDTLTGAPNATTRNLRKILELASGSRENLDRHREEQLIRLLRHASLHCSYYRNILADAGVVKGTEVDLGNFHRIPFLTKAVMRENLEGLLSDERRTRRVYRNTSGGSTGEPIPFYQDNVYKAMNWATVLYYNHAVGKELGEREVKLWGSERDILRGNIGAAARVSNFLYNRLLLNAFRMTPEDCRSHVDLINRFRPTSIWAYVDSIYELARFVEREKLRFEPVPIVITTAGTLTEEVRRYVERTLSTKVFNQYGSREVGPIAAEAPDQKGLCIFEWHQHLEVVDEQGRPVPPGGSGEIVLTLLSNLTMPLIRYRIGDLATVMEEDFRGEYPMRRLASVSGRMTDSFLRRDGGLVHGEYFTHLFYDRDWVRRFQVVQEDLGTIVVRIECEGLPHPRDEAEIERQIQKAMGEDCAVIFEHPEHIEPSPSGKHLYTFSKVRRN